LEINSLCGVLFYVIFAESLLRFAFKVDDLMTALIQMILVSSKLCWL